MNDKIKIIKEDHQWTTDEKIKWLGYGEWVEECDITEFEYLGYQAQIIRVIKREPFCSHEAYFGGHLCGYVQIPETHPYFRKEDIDLECHGGINFNEAHEEHWIGFDCAHSGDYVPTVELMRKTDPEIKKMQELFPTPKELLKYSIFNPAYRNMQYCIEECVDMIDQLIAAINKDEKSIKEIEGDN